jgi:Glucodextranase, domain B
MIQSGLLLIVSRPADGGTLTSDSVIVTGITAPEAVVSVNDQTGIADANGNFSIGVSLDSGLNAIDVIASDNTGNRGRIQKSRRFLKSALIWFLRGFNQY